MDQTAVGKFIAACRREKQLTQVQLADKLNITDRAVSKWETGKSMPDSSIMLELCEILGITVNELLSGEKITMENYDKKADENLIELKRKVESNTKKNMIVSFIFSVIFLMGIAVCMICDIAICGKLTWSLIPTASIIFAWVISFPVLISGKKGITTGLLSLTIVLIPYLYLLSVMLQVKAVFSVGAVMALISIVYLWIIYVLFYLLRTRKRLAAGITALLGIVVILLINIILSRLLSQPIVDIWDLAAAFVLLVIAVRFFLSDYAQSRRWIK